MNLNIITDNIITDISMDSHELFADDSIYERVGVPQMKELFNIICLKFRKRINDICYKYCLATGEDFESKFAEIIADRTVCDAAFDNLRKQLKKYLILYGLAEKTLGNFHEIRLSGEDAAGLYEWMSFQEYIDVELGITLERIGPYDYTKFIKNMRESASFANGMRLKYTQWLTERMIKNSIISTIKVSY